MSFPAVLRQSRHKVHCDALPPYSSWQVQQSELMGRAGLGTQDHLGCQRHLVFCWLPVHISVCLLWGLIVRNPGAQRHACGRQHILPASHASVHFTAYEQQPLHIWMVLLYKQLHRLGDLGWIFDTGLGNCAIGGAWGQARLWVGGKPLRWRVTGEGEGGICAAKPSLDRRSIPFPLPIWHVDLSICLIFSLFLLFWYPSFPLVPCTAPFLSVSFLWVWAHYLKLSLTLPAAQLEAAELPTCPLRCSTASPQQDPESSSSPAIDEKIYFPEW